MTKVRVLGHTEYARFYFRAKCCLLQKITVTEDGDAADVQKSTIKWKSGKGPDSKKRKAGDEDFETTSFIEWFGDDDHILGSLFRDDFFPDAIR